uniref:G domain-containing protein n=1 Tax=Sinocyclocheilus rhinocerous TaxID=307959 RepID=A0A673FRZ7_9TELE
QGNHFGHVITNYFCSIISITEFQKPWRETPWDDSNVKYVRILLAGQVGAGKSSFINSINSVFQGRITTEALADSESGRSFTKTVSAEQMPRPTSDKPCDANTDSDIILPAILSVLSVSVMQTLKKHILFLFNTTPKNIQPVFFILQMQVCSNSVGVSMSHIFPVKNYHEEIDTQNDMDVLILRALTQIVQIADDLLKRKQSCNTSFL